MGRCASGLGRVWLSGDDVASLLSGGESNFRNSRSISIIWVSN